LPVIIKPYKNIQPNSIKFNIAQSYCQVLLVYVT